MKRFLALLLAVAASWSVHAEPAKPGAEPTVKDVSPAEAEALIKGEPGVLILDVCTPDEYSKGHIPGAKNVDLFSDDFERQVAALDASKPVLVHCAAGGRSTQALEVLKKAKKFLIIYHLKAGFSGWKAAGKPVQN